MSHSSTTIIRKANSTHLDELEQLYDRLNDYMAEKINYAGWIKGIYPIRETALKGINENNLFILSDNEKIRGSIILNHEPERAYEDANWGIQSDYNQIIVIHTLVVDPLYLSCGMASKLMEFAEQYCHSHKFQSIRLDVSINNLLLQNPNLTKNKTKCTKKHTHTKTIKAPKGALLFTGGRNITPQTCKTSCPCTLLAC